MKPNKTIMKQTREQTEEHANNNTNKTMKQNKQYEIK